MDPATEKADRYYDEYEAAGIAADEEDALVEQWQYEEHAREQAMADLRWRMKWGNWLYWWGQENLGN